MGGLKPDGNAPEKFSQVFGKFSEKSLPLFQQTFFDCANHAAFVIK
jgi:hypothetical protein